jgi:hypothetical protein
MTIRRVRRDEPAAEAIPEHRDAPMVWVDLDEVKPWEGNPRINDGAAEWLAGKIRIHGFVNPIIIWKRNGVMYAGHTRVKAARLLGMTEVPARFINFPSERAAIEFGLADNRANEQAEWDTTKLAVVLTDELEGVDPDEIEKAAGFAKEEQLGLVKGWEAVEENDPEKEWRGMPEYEHEDQTSLRRVVVHFARQEDVDRFAELVGQSFTDKTRSIWYPAAEIGHIADKRYGEDSPGEGDGDEGASVRRVRR